MELSKQEKIAVLEAEAKRLARGLYAAQVDIKVSEASPEHPERLRAAQAELAAVEKRIAALREVWAAVDAEPETES